MFRIEHIQFMFYLRVFDLFREYNRMTINDKE
jgi:hypothetical protein